MHALISPRDLGRLEEKARHSDYIHTAHKPGDSKDTTESKSKANRKYVSSDSSLLEVPRRSIAKERAKPPQKSNMENHDEERSRSRKRRKNEPSIATSNSSQSSLVQPKQETFERRARHKTKEDRYDTKHKSSKAEVIDKPAKTRREKKGDRKKAARKASEDLMNNFASNKIGQDRLTVSRFLAFRFED